jgi:peptidoglycan DL-endopeptidase CwlO
MELQEDVVLPQFTRPANFRRKSNVLSIAACVVVLPGLLATIALPAYGSAPGLTHAERTSASRQHLVTIDAQKLSVGSAVAETATIQRASFSVIAPPVVAAPIALHRASVGPSLASLLANPAYPNFDLGSVVSVASQYLGVPYEFGGESPAGFDCSGFVAYVYAQFGVSLPHSAAEQGRIGTRIAVAAALPGDVVVMNGGSHVGIYLGGGRMIDAPVPGRVVSNDAIYDGDYYIVRFGI